MAFPSAVPHPTFFLGADLSYVNEMEDHGGQYRRDGQLCDPFRLFHDFGANIVRVRLWHTPTWTQYSTLADVEKTIRRARALGMAVLLDFHYSDTWADPAKQLIPAAWVHINDLDTLQQALHDYTRDVLIRLHERGLMPEYVQIGNEINSEMLLPFKVGEEGAPINWPRNAALINAGIQAVREIGRTTPIKPQVMLHIAQPENVIPWFDAALAAGVTDFDLIGLSYYSHWSTFSMPRMGQAIRTFKERYGRAVMIVETAYPWTLEEADDLSNILGPISTIPEYPATPAGQKQYLIDLTQTVIDNGGIGVIYWEPAWISTSAKTQWGQGSHWDNATFFDFRNGNEVHEGIEFLSHNYRLSPVDSKQ
jgi:arabinogalactan endo-1,4-beta-galactosidase